MVGDIDSSFEAFRNQVNTGLNVGLAGLPWWTTGSGDLMEEILKILSLENY